jgi:hypothetical protein
MFSWLDWIPLKWSASLVQLNIEIFNYLLNWYFISFYFTDIYNAGCQVEKDPPQKEIQGESDKCIVSYLGDAMCLPLKIWEIKKAPRKKKNLKSPKRLNSSPEAPKKKKNS